MFKSIKGRLIAIIADIILLLWLVPWHYYRCIFMMNNNYEIFLIWNEIGERIFWTIFMVIMIFIFGYITDKEYI